MNLAPANLHRRMTLKRLGLMASLLVAVSAGVATAARGVWQLAGERSRALGQIEAHDKEVSDHETRLRSIERELPQIGTDVRWIRAAIEQQSVPKPPDP